MSKEEKKLVADFKDAEGRYNRLSEEVHNLFYPRAVSAFKASDKKLLRTCLDECPAQVTKVFILDLLRQLKLKEGR